MKRHLLLALALGYAITALAADQSTDLRSSAGCGPIKTDFSVKTDKHVHTITSPQPGKALVYVIVQENSDPHKMQIGDVTTRVGLDGAWIGANHGASYVALAVDPGDHRMCTDVQSKMLGTDKLNSAADLSAEAGKTYFYRAELTIAYGDHQNDLRLKAVDQAEGMLLISKTALSSWKVKN
jgi:hypothetical protein